MKKDVLIVIDMQNDFVEGSLGFQLAKDIYKNVLKLVKKFENEKNMIIFTKDSHDEKSYFSSIEGRNLPIIHCVEGSFGENLYLDLEEISRNHSVIRKNNFGSIKLIEELNKIEINDIYMCGIVTDICVFTNAILLRTFFPETKIVVIKDAVASNNKELEEKSLELLKHLNIEVL